MSQMHTVKGIAQGKTLEFDGSSIVLGLGVQS